MRKMILSLVVPLMLGACSAYPADRPAIEELDIASPTMRLIFPLDGETLTPSATSKLIFPIEPTDTPTPTPIGYDPTPTNTMALLFPLEATDTPVYCRPSSGVDLNIGGLIWLDKNGNGAREAGEGGIPGVLVDIRHSTSKVRTGEDGSYELPVKAEEWPVIVHIPNMFFSFDIQTSDSHIASVANGEGKLCFGSSYDVGLVPLLANVHPTKTESSGEENNNPPPSCAQEPNNSSCIP